MCFWVNNGVALFKKNNNKKNQNIIKKQRDQKWKWRTKENLNCSGTKELRGRRQNFLQDHIHKKKKKRGKNKRKKKTFLKNQITHKKTLAPIHRKKRDPSSSSPNKPKPSRWEDQKTDCSSLSFFLPHRRLPTTFFP
jgi:hypothetical protein